MKRRNTPSKEAILNLLKNSEKALSHDVIERQLDIDINRATIYRILNRFCDDEVIHRIVAEDGKQYFTFCNQCESKEAKIDHFYFRCLSCDTIECLHIPVNYATPQGYSVHSTNCVLTGICKTCS